MSVALTTVRLPTGLRTALSIYLLGTRLDGPDLHGVVEMANMDRVPAFDDPAAVQGLIDSAMGMMATTRPGDWRPMSDAEVEEYLEAQKDGRLMTTCVTKEIE